MAIYSPEELGKILASADLSWFTVLLKWQLYRYVVAFTDNVDPSLELLSSQAMLFGSYFDSLTIWWRKHPDGKNRIDIWTSTHNVAEALRIGRFFKQHSIRDLDLGCDIKVL